MCIRDRFKEGKICRDPADSMHAPKIEKKVPVILTVDEVTKLLEQPSGANPKDVYKRQACNKGK